MKNIPAHFKPPVSEGEFITGITDSPEDRIEVGILFVGAGPASLAGAIRLAQLLENEPELKESLGEIPIAVIEKGKYPGAHLVSGAVVNPIAFRKLFPQLPKFEFPFFDPVTKESVYFLTATKAFPFPVIPPTMRNHGNYVASISKMGAWLAEKAEELGVFILSETAGAKLIVEDGVVKGVRTGDKGLDRDGKPLGSYQPGSDIIARVTVLGEGTQGHLTQALLEHFKIKRTNPQIYALGVKEIWEVPNPLDRVIHTMGWPLRLGKKYREFGGTFAYPMGENKVSLGIVVGLDYRDASLSVHDLLQEVKTHPLFRKILEGGRRVDQGWGAKTIPEGGFYSLPEKLSVPGAVIVGDSAGFVNVPALKGIHYAMWSGILAAESIFELLKSGKDPAEQGALGVYDKAVRNSFIWKDLYKVRNMRQAFKYGFWMGSLLAGVMTVTNGYFPGWRFTTEPDSEHEMFMGNRTYPKPDNKYIFDKLTSVYASGNRSRDNQPNHIRLRTDVPEIIGTTWVNMCPAQVYEWVEKDGHKHLEINPTNCVQCGAITAKGGRLTPPEGGSGPEYTET
ncbi:Electron transfer flavoprotein-ubiquinone oxidoreductase [bacterium HR37]|nr:Electron transfer flavoprotein-ubiquinone oxidoreductase [bacterium HR37]